MEVSPDLVHGIEMSDFIKDVDSIIWPVVKKHGLNTRHVSSSILQVAYTGLRSIVTVYEEERDREILTYLQPLPANETHSTGRRTEEDTINYPKQGFEIGFVLSIRDAKLNDEIKRRGDYLSSAERKRVLRVIAEALDKHCVDILQGDATIWNDVKAQMRRQWEERLSEMPEHLRKQWEEIRKQHPHPWED